MIRNTVSLKVLLAAEEPLIRNSARKYLSKPGNGKSRRMVLRRSCKEFLKTSQESLDLHIHQASASFSFGLPVGLTDTIGLCSAEGTRSPLPLTEEPRLVYSNSCKTAADPAQMWDLASPDHFRMPSEANSGTEIHRTSGFSPKTKGVWEIAE